MSFTDDTKLPTINQVALVPSDISRLPAATVIGDGDLFLIRVGGVSLHITGADLKSAILLGISTIINPTNGYLPYRTNSTTFSDSQLKHITDNLLRITNANGSKAEFDLTLSNSPLFKLTDASGNTAVVSVSTGGNMNLFGSSGAFFFGINGSTWVALNSAGLQPNTPGAVPLDLGASAASWQNLWLAGIAYFYGVSPSNYERLAIQHKGVNGIVYDAQKSGSGVLRDHLFQAGGVTVGKISAASGYAGAGTKLLFDDGTYKTVPGLSTDELFVSGQGVTTDGTTPVTILSFIGGRSFAFEATVIADWNSGSSYGAYSYKARGMLRNNGPGFAGIASLEGSPLAISDGVTPVSVVISSVSATQGGLKVVCTGEAGKTVTWNVSCRYTTL